jgi:hypothetical protein
MYELEFGLLSHKLQQYNIEPCHTYNMDERGFMLGVVSKLKKGV